MPREHAFLVEGVILKVLSPKTYRVRLANGHEFLGFIPGKQSVSQFAPGAVVQVQMSPYDLSEGRILVDYRKNLS